MTDETESPTGKVIQEYVRAKRAILGTDAKADDIGDRLDRTLRSRIDVLGRDGEQLLAVASDLVVQKLEELERQAVLEDQGMLEKAERSASGGADLDSQKAEFTYGRGLLRSAHVVTSVDGMRRAF